MGMNDVEVLYPIHQEVILVEENLQRDRLCPGKGQRGEGYTCRLSYQMEFLSERRFPFNLEKFLKKYR